MLSPETIQAYNAVRNTPDKSVLCHAPFTNLNFDQFGNMTACCYNKKEILGTIPQRTIKEAWLSPAADQLRQHMRNNNLGGGCSLCEELLQAGNYRGVKAYFHDEYASPVTTLDKVKSFFGVRNVGFPKVFELELSNTCNLECVMCNGYFSSSIRRNREQLPEQANPYGPDFVEQVAEFLPYLTDIKFLGGEPFLIDIYYDIWERILQINPNIKVHITTNGTVLNNRGKRILEQLKVGIVLSIDSLDEATYESIRVNAKFARLQENLTFFKELVKQKGTYLTFAVCPIIQNWRTLPQMLRIANEEGINLHFNTVWAPEHTSLQFLNQEELTVAIDYLETEAPSQTTGTTASNNLAVYNELIGTLKFWRAEKEQHPGADMESFKRANITFEKVLPLLPTDAGASILASSLVCGYAEMEETGKGKLLATNLPYSEKLLALLEVPTLHDALNQLRAEATPAAFITQYLQALQVLDKLMDNDDSLLSERIELITPVLQRTNKQAQAAADLGTNGAFFQLRFLKQPSAEALLQKYEGLFG